MQARSIDAAFFRFLAIQSMMPDPSQEPSFSSGLSEPVGVPLAAACLGLGTSIPKYRVDHHASAKFAEKMSCSTSGQSRKVAALYRRSGIEHRGSVLLDEDLALEIVNDFYPPATSPEDRGPSTRARSDRFAVEAPILAEQASRQALRQSGVAVDRITHLVVVTCTGFAAPGIDVELIDRLGLSPRTQRVQVGFMGCHGAINGLRVASGLVAADPTARVLMCCVELCSLHYQYGYDPDRIVSGAIFADGAAAIVLCEQSVAPEHGSPGLGDLSSIAESASDPFESPSIGTFAATGSYLVPESRDAMTWLIGNHGYEMTLSARVPGLIQQHLRSFLVDWLAEQGETIESVGGWAVHPGGTRILSAVESAIGLDTDSLDVSREVLSEHGNMSSATILFICQKFAQRCRPKPWLMLGFGPGLEIEVGLIR